MTDSTFQVAKRYAVSYVKFNYCILDNSIKFSGDLNLDIADLGIWMLASFESLLIYQQR